MYQLAVFDLAGSLLTTMSALTWCTNLVLGDLGLPPVDTEDTKKMVGDGFRNQLRRALKKAGDTSEETFRKAEALYRQYFPVHCLHEVVPYEGIPELLEEMKARGMKIACFSNKPDAQAVYNIESIFGPGYFDAVRGEIDGIPRKPDPAGALRIAEQLGVRPENCLYLGDTNTDMRTGQNAGMVTVAVLWGFRGREELESFHPAFIAERPSDVADFAFGGK